MKKITACLLIVLALLAAWNMVSCASENKEEIQEKYVLYIGFAEKTDEETDAIIETVNAICLKYISGFTLQEGEGGWTDENGKYTAEETLIYSFNFAKKSDVAAIANEVLAAIEGSAVLFETQYTSAVHSSSRDFPKN